MSANSAYIEPCVQLASNTPPRIIGTQRRIPGDHWLESVKLSRVAVRLQFVMVLLLIALAVVFPAMPTPCAMSIDAARAFHCSQDNPYRSERRCPCAKPFVAQAVAVRTYAISTPLYMQADAHDCGGVCMSMRKVPTVASITSRDKPSADAKPCSPGIVLDLPHLIVSQRPAHGLRVMPLLDSSFRV